MKRYYITNAGRDVWDRISNGEPAYKVILGVPKARKTVVQAITMSIMREEKGVSALDLFQQGVDGNIIARMEQDNLLTSSKRGLLK